MTPDAFFQDLRSKKISHARRSEPNIRISCPAMPASEDPDDAAVTHERFEALSSPGPGLFPTGDESPSSRTEISSEPMDQQFVDQNYTPQGENDYENPSENFDQLAFCSGIHRSFFFLFLFHKFSFHNRNHASKVPDSYRCRRTCADICNKLFPGICLFYVRSIYDDKHYEPDINNHE